jgi:DNA-directed RNA polymerase subunit beta
VGRYRINEKLAMTVPLDVTTLTVDDIVSIVKYLIDLRDAKVSVDDIDHLSNRRVRTVGEQLEATFNLGLTRMARTIKERMSVRDSENITPAELVHGSDESPQRDHPQAPYVGPWPRWSDARACRLRSS